jgi:predicted PurR-regulated permease PerM
MQPNSRLTAIVTFVTVTGVLYFGRDVLIPLALSVLLAFLLAPAVRRLERIGLNRLFATTTIAALSFAVVAGIVWVTATQFLSLAASLPEYKHNIQAKISKLRSTPDDSIGKATRTIKEIGEEIAAEQQAEKATDATAPSGRASIAAGDVPVAVKMEAPALGPIELLREVTAPLIAPLATAAAVIIFTFIMLLRREDLRDRLIRLVGHRELNLTTQVIEEAGDRVSRYLRMQLLVNASYGVPVGLALHFLGLPNAALWGLLATTLRFIPYLGPWIAAAFPVALAFAVSDGWSLVLWTVAVFLVLELVSNNIVEPWLYSASTGLSAFAVIVAALFWTWLWGTVGLLLAMPLTVCLTAMGRHLPQLAFLNIMLGDEPVLSPHERFYQRLLAMDAEEATELAEDFAAEHGHEALHEQLLIPTLALAERERHHNLLSEERERSVFDGTRRVLEEVHEPAHAAAHADSASAADTRPPICLLPARDEADEIIATMLLYTLRAQGLRAELFSAQLLVSEVIERVAELEPRALCVSALPPGAVLHASALCKRVRARLPGVAIVVALWHADGDIARATQRLQAAGASKVVTTIEAAVDELPAAAIAAPTPNGDAALDAAAAQRAPAG